MGNTEVIVVCHNPACGNKFTKPLGEYNRSQRLGRPHFCSKSCWGKFQGIINFKDKANKDTYYLRDIIRRDDFSPFRFHLKVIKKSVNQRNKHSSITLADLKILWEKQQGICPYTGWNLILLPCTTDYESTPLTTNRASVDRIDSAKGYTPDNIQFVAVIANFAKNAFTEKELIEFCHSVTYQSNLSDKHSSANSELGNTTHFHFGQEGSRIKEVFLGGNRNTLPNL
ncbi:MAG: hypothetical protein VKL59_07930 [Nostocaceae cyanobacterium]|nr:hypothetical protein [Nostocaceae cyanobacterium]